MSAKSWRDRHGSISIAAAVMFPVLIGIAGLATEYGNAVLIEAKMQRIADLAAYGGAIAYSTSPSLMNAAVARIATLNDIATFNGTAAAEVITSPSGDGNNSVHVTVTGNAPLVLARVLGTANQVSVAAAAYAEMKPTGAACMIGLATSGNSIVVDGGSSVTGTGCAVAAKSSISVSSSMTALGVYAAGTVTDKSKITTTPTANNISESYAGISDPVADNAALQAAFTSLSSLSGTVTTLASSVTLAFTPTPLSTDASYPYYSGTTKLYNQGTLPCNALHSISVSGGVSVHISAIPGCNYTIESGISNAGILLQIDGAAGSWSVKGGITGASSTTTLTANSYRITGALTTTGSGAKVNLLTSGPGSSIKFVNAVSLSGGTFTFGDGTYSFNGGLTLSSQSRLYFGNSLLLINGNLIMDHDAMLCGQLAPCGSGTATITIVDNGTNSFGGSSVVNLLAPSSSATYGIPGIVMAGSLNVPAAGIYSQTIGNGNKGTYAGVMYFPTSNLEFSGGTNTSGSNCFEIVANVIHAGNGATSASTCVGFGANVGPIAARLVQ